MCPQKPFDQQTAFAAAVVEIAAAEIAAAAVVAAAVAEMESRGLASLDKFRMDRFPGAGIPHQYISDHRFGVISDFEVQKVNSLWLSHASNP